MGLQSLLYEALNVPMRALLRSPFHAIASRNLCLFIYTGRRSGRRFETPLSYVRDGSTIWLLSSRETRWWTSFTPAVGAAVGGMDAGTPVEVLAAGLLLRGRARTIQHDREHLLASLRQFLTALPRDAVIYGIGRERDRRPREADLAKSLDRIAMVEIVLDA